MHKKCSIPTPNHHRLHSTFPSPRHRRAVSSLFCRIKKAARRVSEKSFHFRELSTTRLYFEGRGRQNLLVRIEIVLPRNVATRRSLHGDFGLGNLILVDPVCKAIVGLSYVRRQQRKRNGTPKKAKRSSTSSTLSETFPRW